MIREARPVDLDAIEKIYDNIHAAEESGRVKIGWISGIYPVRATAEEAIRRRDMFVFEENGQILAAAIINKTQVDVYKGANWSFEAGDDEVCVLHTLVVDPNFSGRGVGSRFVEFYEKYALLFSPKMDIDELNAECADFVGTHDFSAFCAAGASVEDKVRTVESVGFERNGDLVTFRVRGDGFLYNMVRIMVGTCLDIATGKIGKGKIKEIIDSKNRENAGHTAPARGLFLNDVIY